MMATPKTIFDRMMGSLVRRIGRHTHELLWRDPGGALRAELQRRATVAAADFVMKRMPDALYCPNKFDHLSYALRRAPPGLALEFGVFKGTTINHLARLQADRHFYGFDSFTGLPEDWTGSRYSPVNFDRKGRKPKVASNVTLVEGWFDETLPEFLSRENEPIGFLHIDCDIYSSTKTVLELAGPRLTPGAVIAFDEFFNYKGHELHEYKAFFEFVERFDARYRFIAYSGQQVSLTIERVGRDHAAAARESSRISRGTDELIARMEEPSDDRQDRALESIYRS
jgi:predicted O-methyltransferase YrrM